MKGPKLQSWGEAQRVESLLTRRVTEEDIPVLVDIYLESLRDMKQRTSPADPGGPGWRPGPEPADLKFAHLVRTCPGSAWLAELDGEAAGFCIVVERSGTYQLSQFWVRPRLQGRGMGSALLRRAREFMWANPPRLGLVYSSPFLGAVAMYIRLGLRAGPPVFSLILRGADTPAPVGAGYSLRPIAGGRELVEAMYRLDEGARGCRRPQDHAYFQQVLGRLPYCMCDNSGDFQGYCYIDRDGYLGPGACSTAELMPAMLTLLVEEARRLGASDIRLEFTGHAHGLLRSALNLGFQVAKVTPLFLTGEAGLDRYILSGPGLF